MDLWSLILAKLILVNNTCIYLHVTAKFDIDAMIHDYH